MGRKHRHKEHITFEIPKDIILEATKPRFNSHQGGYGAFKSKKDYTRKDKYKKDYKQEF